MIIYVVTIVVIVFVASALVIKHAFDAGFQAGKEQILREDLIRG